MAHHLDIDLLDGLAEVLQITRGVVNDISINRKTDLQKLRVQEVLALLSDFIIHLNNNRVLNLRWQRSMDEITTGLTDLLGFFQSYISEEDGMEYQEERNCFKAPTTKTGEPGRPSIIVSQEQVEGLRAIGMTWENISKILGISSRTLRTKRQEFKDFIDFDYADIDDDELDRIINIILRNSPNMGERMLIGALRSQQIKIQRWKIRESIMRVDPVGRSLRRLTVIHRRQYNVKCPNALWHIDSHHKLIRWRLVIHGCIDGYSRLVIYLHCCTNNTSATVAGLFKDSVESFFWPRRVRTDQGMENIGVARLMLEKFGTESKPVLTGPSVHNQRIERLWKDVITYVVAHHRNLFFTLEEEGLLDPLNSLHLFALEFVYVPRININLSKFISAWNNHPMRSVSSKSPIQIWTEGAYRNNGDACLITDENVDDFYGVDFNGPLPELRTVNDVQVPDLDIELSQDELNELNNVNPIEDDDNEGVQIYLRVLRIING